MASAASEPGVKSRGAVWVEMAHTVVALLRQASISETSEKHCLEMVRM